MDVVGLFHVRVYQSHDSACHALGNPRASRKEEISPCALFHRGPWQGSGYADCDTMVLEAIQKSIHERFAFEQIVPLRVIKVCGDDGRLSAVPLVHQLEEGIDLFGIESEEQLCLLETVLN